jgi:hypothetical protein
MLILALLLDPLAFLLPRVAITLDTCHRSGIFQAFTLQSIKKNRLSLWLLPIILFQTYFSMKVYFTIWGGYQGVIEIINIERLTIFFF